MYSYSQPTQNRWKHKLILSYYGDILNQVHVIKSVLLVLDNIKKEESHVEEYNIEYAMTGM